MEALKKRRTTLRTGFTKALTSYNTLYGLNEVSSEEIELAFCMLEDRHKELREWQEKYVQLLVVDASEEELEKDFGEAEEYNRKFKAAQLKLKGRNAVVNSAPIVMQTVNQSEDQDTVKLPKFELVKFDRNIRGWIQFWSIF